MNAMTKCDQCGAEFLWGAMDEVAAVGGCVIRERVGGPEAGRYYPAMADHPALVLCMECVAKSVKEPEPLGERARQAGLADGQRLSLLIERSLSHGQEKALLRAVADVLHDGRPQGNDRSEAAWKKLSSAQALARRLAEIGAAPR